MISTRPSLDHSVCNIIWRSVIKKNIAVLYCIVFANGLTNHIQHCQWPSFCLRRLVVVVCLFCIEPSYGIVPNDCWVVLMGEPLSWIRGVEHRTRNPKTRGWNRRPERKKNCERFFRVKNVILTRCRCVQPPCVYAGIQMITYAR